MHKIIVDGKSYVNVSQEDLCDILTETGKKVMRTITTKNTSFAEDFYNSFVLGLMTASIEEALRERIFN